LKKDGELSQEAVLKGIVLLVSAASMVIDMMESMTMVV